MAEIKLFTAENNNGSGRSDWHIRIEGEAHSAVFGPFLSRKAARMVAEKIRASVYWDTGEGEG